jgi:DHA3 family macrolide efflux protein-like MFS transporter
METNNKTSDTGHAPESVTTLDLDSRWAPRFFLIWSGQAMSLLGSSLVQFALVWWMTRETGSATVLATATLLALLPQILLGPFIGPLVDRLDRRLIMIVADTGIALTTTGLMLLFMYGQVQLWQVFIVLTLRSLGEAFHHPAMSSSTSLLVPRQHLARVSGLNQTLRGAMNIAAPPIGAVLIMVLPTQGVLAIDLVTAALAVMPLLFVQIPAPPGQQQGTAGRTSYFQDLRAGFSYVLRWPGLSGIILLAMLLNFLLVPSGALAPILVTKTFGLGALELAWTETAVGIGIITGGLILSAWGGFRKRILTTMIGIIGIGGSVLLVGLAPKSLFVLVLAGCFMMGSSQVFANGPLHAIFQSTVDPDMQGRVFALTGAGATAMMPLGLAIAGPFSDRFGIQTWFIFGGILCILVSLLGMMLPAIMNIEENSHMASPTGGPEGAAGAEFPSVEPAPVEVTAP